MIRLMAKSDIPSVMLLKEAEGWNQTETDWVTIQQIEPGGCLVFERAGTVVGTVTVVCYGKRLGWIGMMLVDVEYRRQGIGAALIEAALEYLDRREVSIAKLDATDVGRLLYDKFGFVDECTVERWIRPSGDAQEEQKLDTGEDTIGNWDQHLDQEAFGLDRSRILDCLLANPGVRLFRASNAQAFLRPGSKFQQIGPFVARDIHAAEVVLNKILDHSSTFTIAWDLFPDCLTAVQLSHQKGFTPRRRLTRMAKKMRSDSSKSFLGDQTMQFGIAAFEFG